MHPRRRRRHRHRHRAGMRQAPCRGAEETRPGGGKKREAWPCLRAAQPRGRQRRVRPSFRPRGEVAREGCQAAIGAQHLVLSALLARQVPPQSSDPRWAPSPTVWLSQRPPPSGLDYTGRQTAFGSGQVSPLLPAFAFSSRLSPALPGRPPPSGLSRCRPLTRPPRHFPRSPGTGSHGPGRISVTLPVPLRLPPPLWPRGHHMR